MCLSVRETERARHTHIHTDMHTHRDIERKERNRERQTVGTEPWLCHSLAVT